MHRGKAPSLRISNFKTPVQSTRNVAFVGAPKDLLFNETTSTLSFGLESVTASDTANTNVYAMVSTRDLYYDTHKDDLSGYLKEIASIQDSLTPILTVSAGATVATTSYQGQPATTGGWVLVHRDIQGTAMPSMTVQNVNKATAENDFDTIYSLLGDLETGTGEMIDAFVKVDGKYKFRWIPYNAGDTKLSPYNSERYLEWTQTSNPTNSGDYNSVTGFTDYTFAGDVDDGTFAGLAPRSSYSSYWGAGSSGNNVWYSFGNPGDLYFASGTAYEGTVSGFKTELWIWSENPSFIAPAGPNPFTLNKVVNDTGVLVDMNTVSTGHLYTWAHTLGGSVNARSVVQRVDSVPQHCISCGFTC